MERPLTPLASLGGRVAAALEKHAPERQHAMDVARDQFLAGVMRPAHGRPRALRIAMVLAAALALAGFGWITFIRWTKPLRFTVDDDMGAARTWLAAPSSHPLAVRFSEGTHMRIDPSSRARVVDVDRYGARIALETGVIHADVVHTGTSLWRLIAGPFTVRVTGTRFDLGWDPLAEQFSIAVREGSVAVSGLFLDAERAVLAGQVLRISVPQSRFDLIEMKMGSPEAGDAPTKPSPGEPPGVEAQRPTATASAPEVVATTATSTLPTSAPTASEPASKGRRLTSWRLFAGRGDLRGAFAAADGEGFTAQCATASASELLVLGDAARLAGHADRAVEALMSLRRRYPRDPRRAAAAFALGKVAFDQRRAYQEASDWFSTCLLEQPDGPLAREAAGRRIESLRSAGDVVAAKRAAREYLSRYPDGPHAGVARTLP
ncbi:MAG TPA: FecR domain-containing protein [Polyangiaceae bacterium]